MCQRGFGKIDDVLVTHVEETKTIEGCESVDAKECIEQGKCYGSPVFSKQEKNPVDPVKPVTPVIPVHPRHPGI